MSEKDYYPAGAYNDPNAPYNQPGDPDPIEVACDTCVTLRKEIVVETTNYWIEADDEEGWSETNLEDGYKEIEQHIRKQHTSLTTLLDELAKYINGELQGDISNARRQELKQMLADCQGWSEDYFEIEDYTT